MSSGDSASWKTPRGLPAYPSPGKGTRTAAATSSPARRTPAAQYGASSGKGSSLSGASSSGPTARFATAATAAEAAAAAAARTASRSSGNNPYTHSSAPTAVHSRSIGSLPWQGRPDTGSGDDGRNDEWAGYDGGEQWGGSRAAAERNRIRRILDGADGSSGAATVAATEEDAGYPPTEQDASCDVAAAGIIVACQASGLCDVSMRGATRLPPSLLKFFRAEGGMVSELQLQGNRLSYVPPLELLPALTRLDLSANLLSTVPDNLAKLRWLRALDLSRNVQLSTLPDALCDLTGLTSLDLSHNALECLPQRMGQLNQLVEMRLDSNLLSYLPPEAAGLPSLTALHASHNRLTGLPSELGGASSLTAIFVNHNMITALPATLGQLRQRLADMHLHNNELTVLPRELGLLAALTRITTGCNPLVHPPLAVARRGVAAVREYLLADWSGAGSPGTAGPGHQEQGGGAGSGAPQEELLPEQGAGGGLALRRRRLVLGGACKACADKDDRIEELGQLLREVRERLERTERQLEHSQEKLRRQAQDLAQQAQRAVHQDAEISRLNRQLAAAAAVGPPLGRRPAGGGGAASGVRAEEVQEHLRQELREARGAAETAEAAATAAEREARRLRRDLERREAEVGAYRERSEELSTALAKERERCSAAVGAATEATREVELLRPLLKERDELRTKLEAVEKSSQEAWRAAKVAREGHLSSEATADVMQGKLAAMEAANRRLAQQVQEEKAAAARATSEAESRQAQLQLEMDRLRADLAALTAERQVLHDLARHQVPSSRAPTEAGYATAGMLKKPATAFAESTVHSAWAAPQRI